MSAKLWFALSIAVVGVFAPATRAQNPPRLVPLDSSGLITYYIAEGISTFGNRPGENNVMRTDGSAENFDRYRRTLKTRADLAKVRWLSDADASRVTALYTIQR